MSKRSRRRQARDGEASPPGAEPRSANGVTATAPTTFRSRFRRMPLLVVLACLVGAIVYLINHQKKMGVIEYSSDDPQAQVVLEKDGDVIPIKSEAKGTLNVEPGHYTVRFVSPTEGLKLRPSFINMDPGGRAFVTVRYEPKEAPKPNSGK